MTDYINGLDPRLALFFRDYFKGHKNLGAGCWTAGQIVEHCERNPLGIACRVFNGRLQSLICFQYLCEAIEILYLETHPRWRHLKSMEELLTWLFSQHADKCFWLDVRVTNRPALSLYAKTGFVQVGERPRYYSDGSTALLLERQAQNGRVGA